VVSLATPPGTGAESIFKGFPGDLSYQRRCEMSWVVVKGMYKEGVVEPLESVPYRENVEVLVLFPERIERTGVKGVWQQIKQEIAKEMPDVLGMTDDERREEFDRLSNMIAERMPYHSLEELERAMRGGKSKLRISDCELQVE
jgi:hypothetical protein